MQFSRRSFLKVSGISLATIPFAGALLGSAPAQGADLPLAKETDAMPKSLKYCPNGDKPSSNCPERKKADKKGQYCTNCQLYTKIKGEKDEEIGKCLLMPKNAVMGKGWCISWVKKPGT
jgi:hypothetical protein